MNRSFPLVFGLMISLAACSSGGTSSGSGGAGGAGGSAAGAGGGAAGTAGSAPGTAGNSAGGAGGAGGVTASALQQACREFCVSEEEHNCHADPDTSVEKCMSYRCPPLGEPNSRESPASCAAAYISYYKCLTAQQEAGTANPEEPTKPGCQEPGTCAAEADAVATAKCP